MTSTITPGPDTRVRDRGLRRGLRAAVLATGVLVVVAASPPSAHSSQRSQADGIMNRSYDSFVRFKSNTRTRPSRFDWSDDGCSGPWGISNAYRNLFNKPCQLHDFGYRNYGRVDADDLGRARLHLGRDESTRSWIDDRFRTEMGRVCNTTFTRWWQKANKATCVAEARIVWTAVRGYFGRKAFYGGDAAPDAAPSPAQSPPPAAPSPAPVLQAPAAPADAAVTYAETTGGPTNTWTNYTNAGGAQGPTIPARATVQIACKLNGFRVANGNTWWYRIASSPWNHAYYASADAFYNNGQTAGSLAGTPFVDGNVRDC